MEMQAMFCPVCQKPATDFAGVDGLVIVDEVNDDVIEFDITMFECDAEHQFFIRTTPDDEEDGFDDAVGC